ncbi:MAG: SDR family oxidoreductase [Candidatus Nanopelagicales bacterium]
MKRYVVDGGTAVLTGAASGIGRATARELSARGSHLVLLDRDAEGLEAVAGELRAARPDRSVTTYVVDLADRDAALATATAVRDAHPHVHLLVNNAGVALQGRLDQVSLDDIDWVLAINLHAVILMTHTLLPSLTSTRGSHVVNLSSLFGIIGPPGQAAYVASKFGVRGFSESLRQELAPHGVGVTCVHPGGIATNIAVRARIGSGVDAEEVSRGREISARLLTLDPAAAARRIVDGVERRRPRVLITWATYALDAVARIAPGTHGTLLSRFDDLMAARTKDARTPA